jgi:HAE1 family hydrophobic/amphiphilic exporter-1
MRHSIYSLVGLCFILILGLAPNVARAQSAPFPSPKWFEEVVRRPLPASQVPGADHLRDYVVDGKLRLTLEQAIQLALANNTAVRMDELSYQSAGFSILSAHSAFDPTFTSNFNASRSTSPQSTQLAGAQTLSSLSHSMSMNYNEKFQTGTSFTVGLSTSRNSSNSTFSTFNPSYFSALNFSITQPLLRDRGLFPNRAPILIAQRTITQSRDTFEIQVNNIIQQVVAAYWNVVSARENLMVLRKSVDQAQASYDHDKRSLELGALPPYDIYRTESTLASRKVSVIQAEYTLKQAEDSLRQSIGADLDPTVGGMDLALIEPVEPAGELLTLDIAEAIGRAMAKRPELESQRQQLAIDDINIRLAHNQMQPSLNITGSYSSNGLGGNQIDTSVVPPVVLVPGGLGNALSQVGQFIFPTYGFSLQLNLPIRNRSAEASLGTSEINKRRDLYSQRQAIQNIELESRNAIHQLEQAKLSMAAAKISRDLALKNLEAEQRKYDLGAETLFVLLNTQTELANAEQSLVTAQINYQLALVAVDHATGELLDRHHVEIKDPKH